MSSPFEIIAKSVRLYKTNAYTFLGYSSWMLLTFAAFVLLGFFPLTPFVKFLAFVLSIFEILVSLWVFISLVLCSKAILSNQTNEIKKIGQTAKSLIQPVLTVALLQILMLIGGVLLIIVPSFIFMVWFCFAQLNVIFDGKRGIDALQTSRELVKGKFWKVFLLVFGGTFILFFIYSVILSILMGVIAAAQGVDIIDLLNGTLPLWIQVLEAIGEVLLLPLIVIYLTSVYLEVRNEKVIESKSHSRGESN
ncbi:hypothetical protein HYV69_03705 [Candidatus Uhrbacteria bacterium]|nr:hypothetical protein [Candidatus Uhrbacteria bacterium]